MIEKKPTDLAAGDVVLDPRGRRALVTGRPTLFIDTSHGRWYIADGVVATRVPVELEDGRKDHVLVFAAGQTARVVERRSRS